MRVAVIGGGPSGLVQLKVLLSAHKHFPLDEPIEVKLFESYDEIGGVFLHHVYEDAELVSSKFLTSFSDFRPLPEDADFFSSERYREYLNQYATHFNLWPHIHLSTRVTGVRRGDASEHVVSYQGTDGKEVEWECDAVAVCSGVHSKANIPDIPGIENVPTVLHSQDLKKREQFGKDTTVMVLGSGETGCDMCYLAVTSPTKRVVFCHRDGWIGAPKRTPGQRFLPWLFGSKAPDYPQLPVDVSQITLFDSMYVHPMVRDSMIIWDYYHFVALTAGCWLCGGSKHGVDQWVGQVYGDRFHSSRCKPSTCSLLETSSRLVTRYSILEQGLAARQQLRFYPLAPNQVASRNAHPPFLLQDGDPVPSAHRRDSPLSLSYFLGWRCPLPLQQQTRV